MVMMPFTSRCCDRCAHPLAVGRRWTGQDYAWLVYDAEYPPITNEPLDFCPTCHAALDSPQWLPRLAREDYIERLVELPTLPQEHAS